MSLNASLKIEIGPNRGKAYELAADGTFYIGRDRKCDLAIPSGAVSRAHCKIESKRGVFAITDLHSRLGTFVNDQKVQTRPLRHGDVIAVGSNRLRFEIAEAAAQSDGGAPARKPAGARAAGEAPDAGAGTKTAPKTAKTSKEDLVPLRVVEPDTTLGVFFFSPRDIALRGRKLGGIEIVEPIGKGRRCMVYRGRDTGAGQDVAVKTLRPKCRHDEVATRWFLRGCKRCGSMRHEDAVNAHGGGHEGDVLYLVLDLMEQNAFQRFRHAVEEGQPAVKQALQAVTRVCRALEFACLQHKRLHGGVRPAKVLFDKEGRAKLSGLGFNNRPSGPGLKDPGPLKSYIAPEVLAEGHSRDIRGDIYSLGATFFYMLTGRPPEFDSRGRPRSPREINKAVPDSLVRIVEKTLARDISGRHETHAQLMHDLRWALRGEVWHPS